MAEPRATDVRNPVTAAAAEQAAAAEPAPLRERIYDLVRERIARTSGARTVINAREVATHFGVKPVTIAHHLRALVADGHLVRKPAGRRGTIVWLAPGRRGRRRVVVPVRRRRARGRVRVAVVRRPRIAAGLTDAQFRARQAGARRRRAAARAAAQQFCPWCGDRARQVWRYCRACGHRLPRRPRGA